MKFAVALILSAFTLPLAGCLETYDVSPQALKGWRFGTDTAALNYESDGDSVSFSVLKNNNSKSFREGASVAKHGLNTYGFVEGAAQTTAQRVSDNKLKEAQSADIVKQQEILNKPVPYVPGEGQAIHTATGAGGAVVKP